MKLSVRHYLANHYHDTVSKEVIKKIMILRKDISVGQRFNECCHLISLLNGTNKIDGEVAEVGTFQGGTAKLICGFKNREKGLHLFDTFEGLPEPIDIDSPAFFKGKFKTSYEDFLKRFEEESNVFIYKGLFPDTAGSLNDIKFSFAHFDADLYQTANDFLQFFYSKMNPGGVIIAHDFSAGIEQSFREFFQDKPESLFRIPGTTQCFSIKV